MMTANQVRKALLRGCLDEARHLIELIETEETDSAHIDELQVRWIANDWMRTCKRVGLSPPETLKVFVRLPGDGERRDEEERSQWVTGALFLGAYVAAFRICRTGAEEQEVLCLEFVRSNLQLLMRWLRMWLAHRGA